ncbi:DUF2975 domain-containing protein [Boudabousia liubingyangii]|nr:DUF2975 domain-containing protein [Boudabousia liubingyangii]
MALPLALLYVVIPHMVESVGRELDFSSTPWPYAITGCLTVAAIHVFLLAVWKIVGFIKSGSFYRTPVLRWLTVAKRAVVLGCLMPILTGLHLFVIMHQGTPLLMPALLGVLTMGVAAIMLLQLLVGLYREASANVAELEEVI